MTARQVARRVLDRVDKDGAWATPTLDGELARAEKSIAPSALVSIRAWVAPA